MPRIKRPTTQRFWEKVVVHESGCWLWTGATDEKGYGVMSVENDFALRETLRAHRVSWLAFKGDIPDGMSVLHRCDTPRCVHPEHLFVGFQAANMADMREKGRGNWFGHRGPRGTAAAGGGEAAETAA